MTEYITPIVFLFSTQVLVCLILLFIFYIYCQSLSHQYVQYWLISISALSFSYFVKAYTAYFNTTLSLELWHIVTEFCLHLCQYLFVIFLIVGVLHAKNKIVDSKFKWGSTFLVIALSMISTLLFSSDTTHTFHHFYLSVSLPSFISGCALFALASYLLMDKKRYFATRMLIVFSVVFGFRFLIYSFISIVALTEPWFRQLEPFLIYFDAAAHVILGFILLMWMQGAESSAALSAINRAKYLGKHDSLTGALNREQVMAKLEGQIKEISQGSTKNNNLNLAIFLIDIKQFKFINDTYGLKVGDYVLGEIAKRLNDSVFIPQAVGRLSGDSFMYVIEFESASHISSACAHIHELIERRFIYEHQEITIQCSVGYCCYPEDANNAEELLQKSNLALHHAETNNFTSVAFQEGMQVKGRHLQLMKKNLKAAMKNDEFILYYQPQLNLFNNKLEGVEALVRWQHPEKGLLMPSEFLPELETLGMHSQFDNYILIKACQACERWYKTYKRRVAIAVNITAVEFQNENLVPTIQALLRQYNLPSKYIELEITENVVMTDIGIAMDSIVKLQSMGIKVSIDDFGTGYSSLAYLRDLPIDKIKIDRSFIAEVASNDSDLTIVKSMIDLSHGLGKRVLAEGVETIDQLNVLRKLGCDAVQGYYINHPLPEDKLVRYLEKK